MQREIDAEIEARNIGAALGIPLAVIAYLIERARADELDEARERFGLSHMDADLTGQGIEVQYVDDLDGDDYENDNGEEGEYDSDTSDSHEDEGADDLDGDDEYDFDYDDDGKEAYDEDDAFDPKYDPDDEQDDYNNSSFGMKLT